MDPNKMKIYLELDGEQYQSEIDKSKSAIKDLSKSSVDSGKKIEKSSILSEKSLKRIKFGALAVGAAMGVMAYKLKQLISNELKSIDAQAKMADRYGVTMKAMAGFEHLAGLTGNTVEGLGKSVQQMQLRLGRAAAGTGEAKNAVEKLGLSFQEISEMEPDKAMYRLAEAIQGVESATEQAYIANELFGREGQNMLGVIRTQGSEMAALAGEVSEFAHIMSREAAAEVEAFNDNMFRLSQRMKASKTQMTVELTPALGGLAKQFLIATKEGSWLSDVIKKITDYIKRFLEGVENTIYRINVMTGAISEQEIQAEALGNEIAVLTSQIEYYRDQLKAPLDNSMFLDLEDQTEHFQMLIDSATDRISILRKELEEVGEIEDKPIGKAGDAFSQVALDADQARLAVAEFTRDFEKAVTLEMKIEKDALMDQLKETYGESIEHQREYNEARAEVEREYQERIKLIQDEALIRTAANEQAEVAFREAALRAKFGLESRAMMATQELTSVAAELQGDSNEAFHKAGQAAASAQIMIDAAQAVMRAWAINPLAGVAMGAIIARVKSKQLKEVWSSPKPERAEIEPAPLPSFAQGAWRVPADMIVQVHKDETIMPKPFAEEYRERASGTYNFNFAGSFYDKNGLAEATAESLQIIKKQTGNDVFGGNVY